MATTDKLSAGSNYDVIVDSYQCLMSQIKKVQEKLKMTEEDNAKTKQLLEQEKATNKKQKDQLYLLKKDSLKYKCVQDKQSNENPFLKAKADPETARNGRRLSFNKDKSGLEQTRKLILSSSSQLYQIQKSMQERLKEMVKKIKEEEVYSEIQRRESQISNCKTEKIRRESLNKRDKKLNREEKSEMVRQKSPEFSQSTIEYFREKNRRAQLTHKELQEQLLLTSLLLQKKHSEAKRAKKLIKDIEKWAQDQIQSVQRLIANQNSMIQKLKIQNETLRQGSLPKQIDKSPIYKKAQSSKEQINLQSGTISFGSGNMADTNNTKKNATMPNKFSNWNNPSGASYSTFPRNNVSPLHFQDRKSDIMQIRAKSPSLTAISKSPAKPNGSYYVMP